MSDSPTLLWFRQDLRLTDNPALAAAIARGGPIIPVYLWSPDDEEGWEPGGASRWWLHHALADLEEQLREAGLRLIYRKVDDSALDALNELIRETGAGAVFWNRRYEPAAVRHDATIEQELCESGLEARNFNASLLLEPPAVENKSGAPFKVFTPFWKHCLTLEHEELSDPDLSDAKAPGKWPIGVVLEDLELLPSIRWDKGIGAAWQPTREGGLDALKLFIDQGGANAYPDERDRPDHEGTSKLSPWLHSGQIGPREVRTALMSAKTYGPVIETGVLRQLYWREFAHHLLYHFPQTTTQPLREEFQLFPWETDESFLRRWERGETGYPIVDAGMRQLWQTGWMHNRVRMIVASFLVKHLLQHWLDGSRWFWDTLVDADLANNTLGWQWTAGCGADAAPYFRVFNPIIQGKKFDPAGAYVRTYLPELEKLPTKLIHTPWEAGELELEGAGVRLGRNYPAPIIEHSAGRARALAAFDKLKTLRDEAR